MQNNRIAVTSLGGSGEEARNCFLLEAGNHTVLLDCGVRREALGEFDRVYPALTREIAGRLTAVFLSHAHGGIEQIGQRIIYNEIDMVLFFNDPRSGELDDSVLSISKLCDQHSVPMATNVATAELLIHGLARGDLDWREVMNPNRIPFAI